MVASFTSAAAALAAVAGLALQVAAYDNSRSDNFVAYWGQNSYGAAHGDDPANWQKNLSSYCDDDSIDVFPVSFLLTYFGKANLPVIQMASACNDKDNEKFGDSDLLQCQFMEAEIKACQAKGKIVTISMGGATGSNTFADDAAAKGFADQVWDLFLGGKSETRPFGDAVLDGVDLDIESGGSPQYATFVTQLRTHFEGQQKKYFVTAAPQCIYPDANLGHTLDNAFFDAVYVQFYNNPCGLNKADDPVNWNFGNWDWWARNVSPNKDVKVYLGAPASPTAAGSGYLEAAALSKVATDMRQKYPSFGGVMVWDASQARGNGGFDAALKKTMKANGGTGFKYPACVADFETGKNYNSGDTVTFKGSIWRAKWSAADEPKASDLGSWVPISACGEGEIAPGPSEPPAPPASTQAPVPPASTEAPSTSTAPVPPVSTEAPAPSSTTVPAPTESEPPVATPTEDPCPPEETAAPAPIPTATEDPCPPEETSVPAPPPTPNTGGGVCSAAAFDATKAYNGGDLASFKGHQYKAKWWTQNEEPGSHDVWEDAGACASKRELVARAHPTPAARYAPHANAHKLHGAHVHGHAKREARPTPVARYAPHN